ncbi:hypothetical protein P5673_018547 [Acropora cervicornis]|uniref:Uncharacterized protein n=1 Tax=Acropora cervicornis TaxID=6130 RepID=A0AAD9QCS1_ACRCE|nr:hypothetical protein P5673_018547 [Acropora cervicornis]
MESLKSSYQTTCHTIARNSNILQVTGDSNSPPQVPLILSEKAVQNIKRILKKKSDPYIGLLEYRNTPVTGMTYSPSQLLMSRATRTKIPVATELLQPKLFTEVYQQLKARQQRQVHYYNQGTKPLTSLEPQEVVRLRQGKTWTPAIVDAKAETPRFYLVTTLTGQQYRRNRKDLLQTGEPPPTLSVPEDINRHTTDTDTETQTIQVPAANEQPHATAFSDKSPTPPTPPTRRTSNRSKTLPAKFKDYVMNVLNIEH